MKICIYYGFLVLYGIVWGITGMVLENTGFVQSPSGFSLYGFVSGALFMFLLNITEKGG